MIARTPEVTVVYDSKSKYVEVRFLSINNIKVFIHTQLGYSPPPQLTVITRIRNND